MIKKLFVILMIAIFSKPVLAVEVQTGHSEDPKEAKAEQKTKHKKTEQSLEEKRADLKKKHKERMSMKDKKPTVTEDPNLVESKKMIEDLKSDSQDENARDNRNH